MSTDRLRESLEREAEARLRKEGCTCMIEEVEQDEFGVSTPSSSCPVHGWQVMA